MFVDCFGSKELSSDNESGKENGIDEDGDRGFRQGSYEFTGGGGGPDGQDFFPIFAGCNFADGGSDSCADRSPDDGSDDWREGGSGDGSDYSAGDCSDGG